MMIKSVGKFNPKTLTKKGDFGIIKNEFLAIFFPLMKSILIEIESLKVSAKLFG